VHPADKDIGNSHEVDQESSAEQNDQTKQAQQASHANPKMVVDETKMIDCINHDKIGK
jgi:hypothetical protein